MEPQQAGFVFDHVDGLLQRLGCDLGLALFCQIINAGDGGHRGRGFLIQFDGAQGAVGLKRAQFLEGSIVGALGARLQQFCELLLSQVPFKTNVTKPGAKLSP